MKGNPYAKAEQPVYLWDTKHQLAKKNPPKNQHKTNTKIHLKLKKSKQIRW